MKGFQINIKSTKVDYKIFSKTEDFDNYIVDYQDILIVIEGVILNSKEFDFKNNSFPFHSLYTAFGKDFIQQLEGEIVGFIYDRNLNKIYTFTNFTGTRKLFYYKNQDQIIIDTSLIRLVDELKTAQLNYTLDEFTMYCLLVFGYTLENYTAIKEVKKLCDAEILTVEVNSLQTVVDSYHISSNPFQGKKEDALVEINSLFTEATILEFEKDKELNKESFALLSGGLDSRMTLIVALQNGFIIDEAFCFSQKGYWDEKIARQIAKDYKIPLHFVPLNGGQYITDIDKTFKVTEGLVNYASIIHTQFAFNSVDKNRFGLIHSGQLGDGYLGTFNKHPYKHPPTKEKAVLNHRMYHQIEDKFLSILKNYDREEIYFTRNVGYNRAVLGSYLAENISYQTSPFMYSKLVKLAQSLPENWKFNQQIYIDWINEYQKAATKYTWERTLLKPTSNFNTILGDKVVRRFYNLMINKILKRSDLGNMTAYNYYYQHNENLKNEIENYFNETIDLVESPELKRDLITQFNAGDFNEKSMVLTVLSVIRHYF